MQEVHRRCSPDCICTYSLLFLVVGSQRTANSGENRGQLSTGMSSGCTARNLHSDEELLAVQVNKKQLKKRTG